MTVKRYGMVTVELEDGIEERVSNAAARGIKRAAEHMLRVSNSNAPVESHRLIDSGEATVSGLEAVVTYGTTADTAEYAELQHERMDYEHPHGGGAKFLERARNSEASVMGAIVASETRRAIGR